MAIIGRLALGLCTCVNFLAVLKLIGMLVPPEKIAKIQGYQGGSFCLGTVLPYLSLSLGGGLSWPWAYVLCAFMFVLVLIATLVIADKGLKLPANSGGRSAGSIIGALPVILKSKEIWALGLLHGLSYGTLNNLGQWLPSILSEKSGRPLSFWTTATVIILIIGTLSRFSSGLLLSLTSRRVAIAGVIMVLTGFYVGLGLTGAVWLALILGFSLAAFSGLNYGAIFNLGGLIMPAAFMGTALGFLNMVANMGNVALTLVLGNAKEYTGSFQLGLVLAGLMAIVALAFFAKTVWRLDLRLSVTGKVK
jgi:nitrate/nitrite transporter NarK